jgi:hypothetical protein
MKQINASQNMQHEKINSQLKISIKKIKKIFSKVSKCLGSSGYPLDRLRFIHRYHSLNDHGQFHCGNFWSWFMIITILCFQLFLNQKLRPEFDKHFLLESRLATKNKNRVQLLAITE